jgi:hypothetical protein
VCSDGAVVLVVRYPRENDYYGFERKRWDGDQTGAIVENSVKLKDVMLIYYYLCGRRPEEGVVDAGGVVLLS